MQAESDRNQAQADLNAAEQGMKILGIKNPEDLVKAPSSAEIPVIAPIGGEVVERLVSPGQVMQAGQTQAFTISDMSTVWVLANVYQDDLAYVKTGDDVVVQTDAYPDSFHGKISYVSAALDPNTRTLQARIVVDNPGEKLKRDMYCTVTVTAGVDSERDRRAGCVRAARRRESAVRLRGTARINLADGRSRSAKARTARRKF